MEVIMLVKDIPNRSKVKKLNGSYIYTLVDSVNVYGQNGNKISLTDEGEVKYLIKDTNINAVSFNTQLVWIVSEKSLIEFLTAEQ